MPYGLQAIVKLNPVRYNFIADKTKDPHLGLLAQEVEEVIPEVVKTGDDANKTKAVDYVSLVPVLIRALQEQQQQLDQYKQKVESLEAKLGSLAK